MIDPKRLDYLTWQIPAGERVRLTLLQPDDLALIHEWKSQIDLSYVTAKDLQPISLEERQRRLREQVPSVFAIRRRSDNQYLGEISLYGFNPQNMALARNLRTREI